MENFIQISALALYDNSMELFEYGKTEAALLLVQMIDEHDQSLMEREVEIIKSLTNHDFSLLAFKVDNWNEDLSPWPAPPVFGNEKFKGGAPRTLLKMMDAVKGKGKRYIIGGYSLSALFALWASYETPLFSAVAAASPSIWYDGFLDFMRTQSIKTETVYLSLGDREDRTRNAYMKNVSSAIKEAEDILRNKGIKTFLEWNEGNHFKDTEKRTALAYAYCINNLVKGEEDGTRV